MDFLRPTGWEEALAAKAEHPTAVPIAGGEVVTVEGLAGFAEQREEHGGHGDRATGACGTSLDAAKEWEARPSDSELRSRAGQDSQTGEGVELSPIQQAFIDAGAVQCGFCTPGLLVAADELLERHREPSDQDIREALSGNLCRCTGYEKILDAVRLAAARQERQKETV
ncbi:2Fe-2S iron-sulfur cluster-binding protein [Streptomyces sp. NBC_01353]